jgi:hypothetical protein
VKLNRFFLRNVDSETRDFTNELQGIGYCVCVLYWLIALFQNLGGDEKEFSRESRKCESLL